MQRDCCYQCNKRKLGCHTDCPDYKQLKQFIENIRQAKAKETETFLFIKHVHHAKKS